MNIAILGFVRSLGLGGLIGAGTFGTAYCLVLQPFVSGVGLKEFVVVGALLGAGLCQLTERYINAILAPVMRRLGYYTKTMEIYVLRRAGIMRDELAEHLQDETSLKYFGVDSSGFRQLSLPREEVKMLSSSPDAPNQGAAPDANRALRGRPR